MQTITPGPWHASVQDTINDEPAYWWIHGAGGVVGDVQSVNPADARLIAAAPDLLYALADLVAASPEIFDNRHELAAARAAIARATGEKE